MTHSKDVLAQPAFEEPAQTQARALLHCDSARDSSRAAAMNWVRIHTHDTADLWFGGPAGAVGRPYYRVDVTLMAGAMSKVQRAEVAELMASAVWPREEAR